MLREIIFHKSPVPLLKEGLEAFADRHRAIASAIANSEVPGYRQRGIEFESILKKALGGDEHLARSNARHLPETIDPEEVKHKVTLEKKNTDNPLNGVTNFDIDRRMADMATNQIQYAFTAKMTAKFFEMYRTAARSK